MDIRSFLSASSSKSSASICSDSGDESGNSESEHLEISPAKKLCTSSTSDNLKECYDKSRSHSSERKYNKKWEEEFSWLEYDEDYQGAFCKICRKRGSGGTWITKPFTNWKKATEKMRAHAKSGIHIQSCEVELLTARAQVDGSIIQQLQHAGDKEKKKNQLAIKALLRCTHFLTRQHIAHTTNFGELVDLIVKCSGEDLKQFIESAGRNTMYTSKDSVVEFVEAIGLWVEEALVKRIQQAPFYSLMADECTDISTVEELSIFCRWVEDGVPVEHFLEIVRLKKADAKTIYSSLVDCLKQKKIQLGKIVGMGFDGAATFSGKKTGVQSLLKKHSPHAIFVHCHCHLLQLACVQAANRTTGIKHMYTTLSTLWKFFHYSPKRTEGLKEIQRVLNLPELKIIKPSDTRWLSHERCVKAVKQNYCAIVVALNNIYEQTHEPEALGISKVLCKQSSVSAIYLLDYILPQVAKLSKGLQTVKLDLAVVSGLVESTLYSLGDALLPEANWVLELLDECEQLKEATGISMAMANITSFQETVAKPFVIDLKDNIASRFSSQDIISSFTIFNPKKVPTTASDDLLSYGEEAVKLLISHYGVDKQAETIQGEECVKPSMISSEIHTEWKTFRRYVSKKPEETMSSQLKELTSNAMLTTMFPNLSTLANICLTIPVTTAAVERSFSQMKLIKTRLRSRIGEKSLSYLMKIAIESPESLSEDDLDSIIEIWKRKPRRIAV